MTAPETTGLLPHLGDLTSAALERWVAAALAQAAALREHDDLLYPTDPARMPAAERLHDAWRHWSADAEALLARVRSARAAGGRSIAGTDDLWAAAGWAGAMLQLSPATVAHRRAQVERGEVYTIEEVRRELRLGPRR